MEARRARGLAALAFGLALTGQAGCGDPDGTAEVVVRDARLGGAAPRVIGATPDSLFWSASDGGTTRLAAAPLAALPAAATELATATGPIAMAGDQVVFAADGLISHVDAAGTVLRVRSATPEALAASATRPLVVAWTEGADVSWGGADTAEMTATLTRVESCDHGWVTDRYVYVAAEGGTDRRLVRIDRQSAAVTSVSPSRTWAPMFPGGGRPDATYAGRIVHADDDAALWLVEEMPSRRAILVREPVLGEPSILLAHVANASAFFVTADALYWQETDALLTASRDGGPASIAASLPGEAGALVDGYVYFARGDAIERFRVE